jgi:alkaline phosphatase D
MPLIRFVCEIRLVLAFLVTTSTVIAQEDAGPMVGHVATNSARLLIRRGAKQQTFRLHVIDKSGRMVERNDVIATEENDYVAKFHVTGLDPSTRYQYRISEVADSHERVVAEGEDFYFQTCSANRQSESVTLCFTSCVDIEENPMWAGVRNLRPDMLFLMGDTPYIDSSDLNRVRSRHRSFLNIPVFADVIRNTPTVGIWDDHDFGLNNGNGRNMKSGKSRTRQGFVEYRAHSQYGTGSEGVYHKVDTGMMEVFLLDPRYFSQTEPSPVDPTQPTCFGHQQWKWLRKELKESKAPFKVLAMGAIWQDKQNSETDDMFTYWYERDALLDFVAKEQISGVVLLGGDIHVSRHLVHPLRVGYDLHDFIISPGHKRVISALDVYHPSLRWSLIEGHQFLSLTADGSTGEPRLIAEFRQAKDTINRKVTIRLSEPAPGSSKGLSRGLRAHWSFDTDFSNSSPLGKYVDAKPNNGAQLTSEGRQGGAVSLKRSKQQFLSISRNPLDDNSDEHTFAMWCRPTTLPRHNTSDRCFLLESTAQGKPSDTPAWHLSLGLRASRDPNKVNLQLYTHTLVPASKPEAAPSAKSQGGFDCLIDRKELTDWTHITCLFDSKSLTLYLNGQKRVTHKLSIAGPASEFGGLIIGGHRAGTGRNFDGTIDEPAIWSRLLSPDEISHLMQRGLREESLSQ